MNGPAEHPRYAVVVPTLGRPSLRRCLEALAAAPGPGPARLVLVHDRPGDGGNPPDLPVPEALRPVTLVVPGRARGPAAARNTGARRAGNVPWIVFLDDDVVPSETWRADLARDLAAARADTAAVTARIDVPLPGGRRPTDNERNTAGLATARWITADMAVRTEALDAADGFDERFHRAFREDADLALRLLAGGWHLAEGSRRTTHPARAADRWTSVRQQAGNADDVLMRRLHGPDWRASAAAPRGRLSRHRAVTAAGAAALVCALTGHRAAALACALGWAAGTAEFTLIRVLPGPRTRQEITDMILTSAVIPPAATWHWLRGLVLHRSVIPGRPARAPARPPAADRAAGPAAPTGETRRTEGTAARQEAV
ncbi:glycosyltransferase [Streptomyces sp.]|uniref:glycosyltransferase family 2 protein n=3 Tax=Streptomyces sp. TaxID=1931 RepID=UPI002810BC12|nr:glycosyltransferase [Streptomyces sp.]